MFHWNYGWLQFNATDFAVVKMCKITFSLTPTGICGIQKLKLPSGLIIHSD